VLERTGFRRTAAETDRPDELTHERVLG
jgi:hypothetical protein